MWLAPSRSANDRRDSGARLNPVLLIGVVLNGLLVLCMGISVGTGVTPDTPTLTPIFFGISELLCIAGVGLIATGRRSVGGILVIIGCIPFLPLGLVGIWGVRKVRVDAEPVDPA